MLVLCVFDLFSLCFGDLLHLDFFLGSPKKYQQKQEKQHVFKSCSLSCFLQQWLVSISCWDFMARHGHFTRCFGSGAISRGVVFFFGWCLAPELEVRCISVTKQKSWDGTKAWTWEILKFTQIWICEVEYNIGNHNFQQVFTHGHVKIVAGFQTKKLQEVACCHHGP